MEATSRSVRARDAAAEADDFLTEAKRKKRKAKKTPKHKQRAAKKKKATTKKTTKKKRLKKKAARGAPGSDAWDEDQGKSKKKRKPKRKTKAQLAKERAEAEQARKDDEERRYLANQPPTKRPKPKTVAAADIETLRAGDQKKKYSSTAYREWSRRELEGLDGAIFGDLKEGHFGIIAQIQLWKKKLVDTQTIRSEVFKAIHHAPRASDARGPNLTSIRSAVETHLQSSAKAKRGKELVEVMLELYDDKIIDGISYGKKGETSNPFDKLRKTGGLGGKRTEFWNRGTALPKVTSFALVVDDELALMISPMLNQVAKWFASASKKRDEKLLQKMLDDEFQNYRKEVGRRDKNGNFMISWKEQEKLLATRNKAHSDVKVAETKGTRSKLARIAKDWKKLAKMVDDGKVVADRLANALRTARADLKSVMQAHTTSNDLARLRSDTLATITKRVK